MITLLFIAFTITSVSPTPQTIVPTLSPFPAAASADTVVLTGDVLQTHTTYFELTPDRFTGADTLERRIGEAAFVALGELHNSRNMTLFTETLLRFARPLGFDRLAVETGPWSAEKLEQLIEQGPEKVSSFYDEYSSKLFNIYPIPFFTGKADLDFLAAAHNLGYDLWGLDQEFYYSFAYLVDELARHAGELSKEQQELRSDLKSRLWWWQKRSALFSGFAMSCRLQEDEDMQRYLHSLETSAGAKEAVASILSAIRRSLEIYCMAESGEWSESNKNRIAYFKENFDAHYLPLKKAQADALPRVILKMGSYHSGRDRSPLKLYDIGHHLYETAGKEGRHTLHLRFLHRWVDGDDKMHADNYRASANFMKVADKQKWALIDTQSLREQLANGKLKGSDFETREIQNYDYIILMPEDQRVDKHY